jgi:hypothetical protein
MSGCQRALLAEARTALDSSDVSESDRSHFIDCFAAAVNDTHNSNVLILDPARREPWARSLLWIANALLAAPDPEPPADPQPARIPAGPDSEGNAAYQTDSD